MLEKVTSDRMNFQALSIEPNQGVQYLNMTVGAGTDSIPLLASGASPKFCSFVAYQTGAANSLIFISLGSTQPGGGGDGYLIGPRANSAKVLNVTGYTDFSWYVTGAGLASLTVYPLADF